MKGCKGFVIWNLRDCWKMHFQRKKHWKYVLWSGFLWINVLKIELWQLQKFVSYWNEKDGRFRFETQLKIEFLPPNNSSKKCIEKFMFSLRNCKLWELINYLTANRLAIYYYLNSRNHANEKCKKHKSHICHELFLAFAVNLIRNKTGLALV